MPFNKNRNPKYQRRLYIGSSHDTGHYVHMTHKNISDSAVEVLLPYVDFENIWLGIHLKYRIGRLLEKLVINKYVIDQNKSFRQEFSAIWIA